MATNSHPLTLAEAWELEAKHGVTLGRPTGAGKTVSYYDAALGESLMVREEPTTKKGDSKHGAH
jgi:hypothetical protein